MNRRRTLWAGLAALALVVVVTGGFYMLQAGAQDRPYNTDTQGPRPAGEVLQAPTPQPEAQLQVVRSDNFDTLPKDWRTLDSSVLPDMKGVWTTESGKLVSQAPVVGGDFEETMFLAPVDTSGRARVSAQVFPQGNLVVGLAFRASDGGYYLFRVFRGENTPIRRHLQRFDAQTGTYVSILEDREGSGYELGRWQELRVELDGDLITCYFDGEKVFETRDSTLTGGEAGVYTLNVGEVMFDQFAVAKP